MSEEWKTLLPGLRQKISPPGPWFQYHDAVGFEWNTFEIDLPDLPPALDGFRLLQLSDLHCQPHWQTAYDELIDRIDLVKPHLILITGDIIDDILYPERCLPTARKFLNKLSAPSGVIGIRGNHDEFVEPADLKSTPLQFIDGQRVLVNHHDAEIELIAPHGPLRTDFLRGYEKSIQAKIPGVPRIILSHYPDHIRRMRSLHAEIFLSGHTHGGQICLPGRIPILRHDSLPIKYFLGAHCLFNTFFFVNRGLGFSTHGIRIFCPAEVIEIRLCRK